MAPFGGLGELMNPFIPFLEMFSNTYIKAHSIKNWAPSSVGRLLLPLPLVSPPVCALCLFQMNK